jgi:hypothetical protein
MKCPYCGKEMKPGYLQTTRRVIFTEKPRELFFWPWKKDQTVIRRFFAAPNPAFHCPGCKKVIVDYSGEEIRF